MKPIKQALEEARTSLLQLALFQSALDTLVVYMLILLGCTLLTLPLWYAVVPALVYAFVHTRGNLKDVNFSSIEAKYPQLSEQLITVADNVKDQNEILDALNAEVLQKMREIKTAAFLNFPKVTRELTVMMIVSFIIIGASAFNVKFLDFKETVKDLRDFEPFKEYDINEELLEYEESQNLSEILGEKTIEELGKQQLDLELNPLMSDVDIGKVRDPTERTFREVPPPDIKASSDTSFEENIPKQYQRIVKTYFKEITKS